jgi:hypothetical protein
MEPKLVNNGKRVWRTGTEPANDKLARLPLLLALTRLTLELSRAAKRRRLGRIVRHEATNPPVLLLQRQSAARLGPSGRPFRVY